MKNKWIMNTRLFLAIPCVLICLALILSVFGLGMNFGIDFTGGSLLNYSVGEAYDVQDVYTILDSLGYTERQVQKTAPTTDNAASAEADETAAEVVDEAVEAVEDTAAEAADAVETAAEDVAETATEAVDEAVDAAEEVADEAADAVEEVAEEAEEAAEEVASNFVPLLNADKSGIANDGLTDLQVRLNLKDETKGLEDAVDAAVKAALSGAEKSDYRIINALEINTRGYDSAFSGGFVAEYKTGAEFDAAAVEAAVLAALEEAGYPVEKVTAIRYDAEAEKAADEAAAAADAALLAEAEETTEETADTAEDTEEVAAAEEDTEETTEAAEATGTDLRLLVSIDDQTTQVRRVLEEQMSAKYEGFHFTSIDHVSAVAGRDLISNAVKALLIAFAGMLIYIAIRFDVFSGLAALFALAHDVLVMCAFMVFFRWKFQVNSPFIAAVLTIVGYSINNTIIIFDRIRETAKMPGFTQLPRADIVEHAVNATLSRTINTALTTLITLVTLYIFGVESIREFAFPLIVGMLAGVYSSVLLSGQVWAKWVEKFNARKAAKKA